jgi:hypothetical protein
MARLGSGIQRSGQERDPAFFVLVAQMVPPMLLTIVQRSGDAGLYQFAEYQP